MEKSLSGRGELLSIAYLVDYPHYLPTVAGWVFNEWGFSKSSQPGCCSVDVDRPKGWSPGRHGEYL
jgi:hypothetical protein